MYAVVDVKDKQFKVRDGDTLYVPYHSDADAGDELTLDRVLLVSDGDGEVTLGTPTVDGASASARVVEHVKGDKVIVFKKKRRKRHRVKRGHRQQYTQIEIEALNVDGEAAAEEEEAEVDEEPAAESDVEDEGAEPSAEEEEAEDVDAEKEEEDADQTPEDEDVEEKPDNEEDEEAEDKTEG